MAGGAITLSPQEYGSSFSNTQNTATAVDNANVSAAAQTAYAPVISSETGDITYNGSDYGAIQAGATVFGQAQELVSKAAYESQYTARKAIQAASDTVANQGSGALSMITKPFLWAVGIITFGVVFVAWFFFRKKD